MPFNIRSPDGGAGESGRNNGKPQEPEPRTAPDEPLSGVAPRRQSDKVWLDPGHQISRISRIRKSFRRKVAARPAATKEFKQEHTENTEAEKFCQKCVTFRYSTAKSPRCQDGIDLFAFAPLRLCVKKTVPCVVKCLGKGMPADWVVET